MKGRINSIYTGSALDGPGIRTVVFFQGCPLKCVYCHNPETHDFDLGEEIEAEELFSKLLRYRAYYGKNGGVTFSGGEPLCQLDFLCIMLRKCRDAGIKTAIDTSGTASGLPLAALRLTDLVILDIKLDNEEEYKSYTGGSFSNTVNFLAMCDTVGVDTWVRRVIVPEINDTPESVAKLCKITEQYKCVKRVQLLPFEKLCTEKYERLGIPFPLKHIPAMDRGKLRALEQFIRSIY